MIGLLIITTVFVYVLLAKWVVKIVYRNYSTKKAKNIALAIMILIPTWDIILGYPIYKYLCLTKAGVHIYKTVDNVEGFYIGEKSKDYEPYEPYKGYKYIDYKEEKSDKYYRSYWVDNNTSKDCVPYGIYKYGDYAKAFRHGKCIVKKEISEGEVSRWEYDMRKNKIKTIISIIGISEGIIAIRDRKTDKNISESISFYLDNNWFVGFIRNITSTKGIWSSCGVVKNMLRKTLKSKQEK